MIGSFSIILMGYAPPGGPIGACPLSVGPGGPGPKGHTDGAGNRRSDPSGRSSSGPVLILIVTLSSLLLISARN